VEVVGSIPNLSTLDIMAALTIVIFFLNYVSNWLVSNTSIQSGGGIMERLEQIIKHGIAAVTNGVSAVCSGVVATGLTSGLSLEGLSLLGFHQS